MEPGSGWDRKFSHDDVRRRFFDQSVHFVVRRNVVQQHVVQPGVKIALKVRPDRHRLCTNAEGIGCCPGTQRPPDRAERRVSGVMPDK